MNLEGACTAGAGPIKVIRSAIGLISYFNPSVKMIVSWTPIVVLQFVYSSGPAICREIDEACVVYRACATRSLISGYG
jgi:hypothetical protein